MENNKEPQSGISSQSQNTPDPLAAMENNSELSPGLISDGTEEVDIDEAIHQQKEAASEENKQQDGDDAVHKNYKPVSESSHESDERDPDDAVHGN